MITRIVCILTGAADALSDVDLPVSSLRVTHRDATASSFSLVLPSFDRAADIQDRPNGQVVATVYEGAASAELMRGSIYSTRTDEGGTSRSMTLTGAPSQASPPLAARTLTGITYRATDDDGARRLRAAPIVVIRPGDTLTDEGTEYTVDTVNWTAKAGVGSLQIVMELSLVVAA